MGMSKRCVSLPSLPPVSAKFCIRLNAGQASPSPPVGPIIGSAGISLKEFCTQYNSSTSQQIGSIIPTFVTIYADKTFLLNLQSPHTAMLLLEITWAKKGSAYPSTVPIG